MHNDRNYQYGYTSRNHLDTNIDDVKSINAYNEENEESLLNYAERVIQNLARSSMRNATAKCQAEIINSLITLYVSSNVENLNRAESNIQRILSKYNTQTKNKLCGWLSHQRTEFDKRKNYIV